VIRLVDVRPREVYLAGHVPGAVHLDPEDDLTGNLGGGRHPLPRPEAFAATASRAGIGDDTFVLAYDEGTGWAARLWWLLRHHGHDACGTFDLRAYMGLLTVLESKVEPARFTVDVREDDTVDADELLARLDDPDLVRLDARAPERWRGEVEPLDKVAGRIPGARNAFFERPLPEGVIDAPELVVYCGSGVTACVPLMKLVLAGREDARLYPGSYSEWSTRDLPIETGEPVSGS
jgi:thiosulfate/3-mercaptopyruvate sulfurtransferase